MSEQFIYEYNHATGEESVRPISAEEKKIHEAAAKAKAERISNELLAKEKRESGRAKLLTLGLTQDEIEALIGKEPEILDR